MMGLRDRRSAAARDEDGMTLVELIVAMGIFVIVIAVFMSGIVVMTQNTARAQAVADSGDGVRVAFQRLDKEVRYAAAINQPGFGSDGAYYVEYLTTAVAAGAPPVCTQWRVVPSTRVLQRRTWNNTTPVNASQWLTVTDNVRNDLSVSSQLPFVFTPAGVVRLNQSLRVLLDVGNGPPGPDALKGAQLDAEFVARNTDGTTPTNSASNTKVCLTGMGRS